MIMQAYGMPRGLDIPDCRFYARKSCLYNLPGKGGDIHNAHRAAASKRALRRLLKRAARREGRIDCRAWEE
jgi:hypothetical protein